jgi:diguanylate cyclase (GGDEF)-like protein
MDDQEKILLADDDPQLRDIYTRFLSDQGFAVTATADGLEALQALQGEEFHLALVDLAMPGVSGLELLSHIKTHCPHTEVILFTGHAELDSAIQALRLGAYDYLLKADLRLADLHALVARALERRRLALSNRELLNNLCQAQKELSRQRSQELTHVRLIGEALAVPLTWEQLFHGLLNLIWESLPLSILAMEFQGPRKELSLEACRRQPGLKEDLEARFKAWLKERFHRAAVWRQDSREGESPELPVAHVLWAKAQGGGSLALVAGGRDTPFSPEESELFRIFVLQGEAALKNLELFEEVKSLAIRDGLTGLYNYRHFWELLVHEVEKSRRYLLPLSLLFLDLDNFKVINDTLGHSQGDVVLKTLAAYLQGAVRQADVACRYGGEEFVMLLPQTELAQGMQLAERLRQKISQMTIPLPQMDLRFTVSIGVAELSADMDAEALVEAADRAMYRAKQSGKNQVCGPLA